LFADFICTELFENLDTPFIRLVMSDLTKGVNRWVGWPPFEEILDYGRRNGRPYINGNQQE